MNRVMAVLNKDNGSYWAVCGACGSKLFKITKRGIPRSNSEIEIQCKRRSSGKTCKTMNIVVF